LKGAVNLNNKIMKIISYLIFLLLPSSSLSKTALHDMPSGKYKLDLTHSSVIWKVSHLGLSKYTARFADFDGEINFNAKQPTKSSVEVSIDPSSIKTQYPYPKKKDFDKKLIASKDWFNVKKFPKITFTSKKIKILDDQKAIMRGNLNFMGVSKPIALNVKLNGSMVKQPFSGKPTFGFSANTVIKRSEFGMDTYVPGIGDEVEVIIEAEFYK
jgi:polyisoprenoid-binding protein YceI